VTFNVVEDDVHAAGRDAQCFHAGLGERLRKGPFLFGGATGKEVDSQGRHAILLRIESLSMPRVGRLRYHRPFRFTTRFA